MGVPSAITLVVTDDVPAQMAAPSLTIVRYNLVEIYWTDVTDYELQGRDPINYYQVWWDQGTGNWVQLTSNTVQYRNITYTHHIANP
jgi:hypothetical protein